MKEIELKRCPFCGGTARISTKVFGCITETAMVYCERCGAQTEEVPESEGYGAAEKAADLWNHRIGSNVVFCKDCVHWMREFGDLGTCDCLLADVREDNYCRNGKRKKANDK